MARVVFWLTDEHTGSIYVSGAYTNGEACLVAIDSERQRHRHLGLVDPLIKYEGMQVTVICYESDQPIMCLLVERLLDGSLKT